jgi:hypothetical protein
MRDRFLGDSLDMSKRTAVCLLRDATFSLGVCPLPSQGDFSEAIYRSCLGLKEKDKLFNPPVRFRAGQREKHLTALRQELLLWKPERTGIAILDPDKGVHDSQKSNQFITVNEVKALVELTKEHIVAVYHHKNAGSISYLDLIGRFLPRPAMAYDFGAAVLCFVHTETDKLQKVSDLFSARLNPARILRNQVL